MLPTPMYYQCSIFRHVKFSWLFILTFISERSFHGAPFPSPSTTAPNLISSLLSLLVFSNVILIRHGVNVDIIAGYSCCSCGLHHKN